jgi:hypothetical protein
VTGKLATTILLVGMALQGSAAFAEEKGTPVDLSVAADGSCQARIGDQTFAVTMEVLEAKLPTLLPDKKATVRFSGATYETVPYRCFGSMIFGLQRLGYKSISWVAEGPPLGPEFSILERSAQ